MLRRGVAFAAVFLSALTMGLEFAHVLEWPRKQHYDPALYARLQESLYVWFGNLGGIVYVLAVATTVTLAVLMRREPPRRYLTVAAAAEVTGLITFLTIVWPVNGRFPVGPDTVVPPDWASLRNRWETGHAVGFILFTVAFICLARALLRTDRIAGRSRASTSDTR
jgi:hypothetical protein